MTRNWIENEMIWIEYKNAIYMKWLVICKNENEYYVSPANSVCYSETWWNDTNEPYLKCRDEFPSDFVPDAWVLGEKDLQSLFNDYCVDEYIATPETAAPDLKLSLEVLFFNWKMMGWCLTRPILIATRTGMNISTKYVLANNGKRMNSKE